MFLNFVHPRRLLRLLRFRTRTLLIFVTLICVVLGSLAYDFQRARRARLLLKRLQLDMRIGFAMARPRTFLGVEVQKIPLWKRFTDYAEEPFLCCELDHINYETEPLDDAEFAAIVNQLPCHNLCVRHSTLTDTGMRNLTRMPLTSLWLHDLNTPPATFEQLAQIESLEALLVNGPGVTDEHLACLPKFTHVCELQLCGTGFTEAGLRSVAQMPSLRYLSTGGAQLTDAQVDVIAGIDQLERLELCGAGLNDAQLARLARLPNLNSLMLYNNPITAASLPALARLPRLTTLDVRNTQIGDADAPKFASFTRLKSLTFDKRNRVSKPTVTQLQAALPGCDIEIHDPRRPGMATPFVARTTTRWFFDVTERRFVEGSGRKFWQSF
jgi:Leucine-rich repeat (LRR) protein